MRKKLKNVYIYLYVKYKGMLGSTYISKYWISSKIVLEVHRYHVDLKQK